jgi:hypothetical protein
MPFSLGYRLLITGSCTARVTDSFTTKATKVAKTEGAQKGLF